MKIPLSWLSDYIDIELSPQALAERLTLAGLEVESVTHLGEFWDRDKLFVGQVLEVNRHPDADRLVLARVNYGASEPLTVVTGAPNLYPYAGQVLGVSGPKIAFAVAGARLIDGHQPGQQMTRLKPNKIRGVTSEGMACSEKELGLSDEHEGIIFLPPDAPIGVPLVDYLGDTILEFDIKGAFGHLQSVIGIAREVAALVGQPLKRDVLTVLDRHPVEIVPEADFVRLVIEAPDLCPRYSAALIENLKLGPSPFWMQTRLQRAGMRPINNVVDVTNYVMLELGQPLHAFDYDLLRQRAGGERPSIIMRRARQGEHMTTLDGVDRTLDPEMLMITDTAGSVAVAGVMGGLETEVNGETTRVLLESANFNFLSIRRTAQMLKLSSEAASRFGKQVDPELTMVALSRAGQLLAEIAGGMVRPVYADAYPVRPEPHTIDLDPTYVDRLLGVRVPVEEMVRILRALEFTVVETPESHLRVGVPSHRLDVCIPADLVEEIVRIYGYDRVPPTRLADELPQQRRNLVLEGETQVADILAGAGLTEVITYSMINLADEARLRADGTPVDPAQYVGLQNPLSSERSHLRRSLLQGLVNVARLNLRFRERVAVFELGRVFLPQSAADGPELPAQPHRLGALMVGPREPVTWQPHDTTPLGFFDLKGVVETLLQRLDLPTVTWERAEHPSLHGGRAARLLMDGAEVGVLGELHPRVRAVFDLPADRPVVVMELDLDALFQGWGAAIEMAEISPHPAVYEDLALIVEESIPAGQVTGLIRQTGGKTLVDLHLFDVYRGQPIPEGKKSLAYALTFQAPDRTLTDQDVRKLRHKITNRLEREIGATLRA